MWQHLRDLQSKEEYIMDISIVPLLNCSFVKSLTWILLIFTLILKCLSVVNQIGVRMTKCVFNGTFEQTKLKHGVEHKATDVKRRSVSCKYEYTLLYTLLCE